MRTVFAALCVLSLIGGCRSIPCNSIDALTESYDIFLDEYFEYIDNDERLTAEDRAVIRQHVLAHSGLLRELGDLCDDEY